MKDKIIFALIILIIIMVGYIISINIYEKEDVNRDGQVNALDLLIVQKKIIHDMEKGDDENELYKNNMGK